MTVINYKSKIDAMQALLKASNTITADYDLSTNMAKRVQLVSQINPDLIAGQSSLYPALSIRIDSNTIDRSEMASTNIQARMKSVIEFMLVGQLWYDKVDITNNVDLADEEIHYFAENVEEVLRRDHQISNTLFHSEPIEVNFYEGLDEQSHFRTFVMNYQGTSFY